MCFSDFFPLPKGSMYSFILGKTADLVVISTFGIYVRVPHIFFQWKSQFLLLYVTSWPVMSQNMCIFVSHLTLWWLDTHILSVQI